MADWGQEVNAFIQTNWYYIIIAILGLAVIYFLTRKKPVTLVPIDRNKIEKENFYERIKFNECPFTWLKHGKTYYRCRFWRPQLVPKLKLVIDKDKGEVDRLKYVRAKDDAGKDIFIEVFEFWLERPLLYPLTISSNGTAHVITADMLEYRADKQNTIFLKKEFSNWFKDGVYYDDNLGLPNRASFVRDYTAQTDYNEILKETYATMQENSVVDLNNATNTLEHHLALEELKEQRKKSKLNTSS